MRSTRIMAMVLVAAVSVSLTACNNDDGGKSGAPEVSGSSTKHPLAPSGGSKADSGDAALLKLDPCRMLTVGDVSAVGAAGQPEPFGSDSSKWCTWGEYAFTFVDIRLKKGVLASAQPVRSTAGSESTVDGRRVLRFTE